MINDALLKMQATRKRTLFLQKAADITTLCSVLSIALSYGYLVYLQGLEELWAERKVDILTRCLSIVVEDGAPSSVGEVDRSEPAPTWNPLLIQILLDTGANPNEYELSAHGSRLLDASSGLPSLQPWVCVSGSPNSIFQPRTSTSSPHQTKHHAVVCMLQTPSSSHRRRWRRAIYVHGVFVAIPPCLRRTR